MAQYIGAQGVALPVPVPLYPRTANNLPTQVGTNRLSLPGGGTVIVPSGDFIMSPGNYSSYQFFDPVSQTWLPQYPVATTVASQTLGDSQAEFVRSDGQNFRLANLTGCPVAASVTNAGSGYISGVPTVAATGGNSTWVAVVGGGISAININSASSGAGYGVSPIVNIDFPASPGVPATAIATINSSGAITLITVTNSGAGYTSVPAVTIVPNPGDPNVLSTTGNITNATATAVTSYVGQVTAVLMTSAGQPVVGGGAVVTLAITGGGGSSATAVCLGSGNALTDTVVIQPM